MVEGKERKDPLEAAKEAHRIYLEPATFLVSRLGLAIQAGVEIVVDHYDRMGSKAELTFGSLFYQFIVSISEEVGRLGLIADMEKLNRLALPKRAEIFCDANCAQRLVNAGFSYDFAVLIARKLGVAVPKNPVEVVSLTSFLGGDERGTEGCADETPAGPRPVIGTTYVRVADVFREVDDACGGMELVDTRHGSTDRFGEPEGSGGVRQGAVGEPSSDMGSAPTGLYGVGESPSDAVLREVITEESRDKPSRISWPSFLRQIGGSRLIDRLLKAFRGEISRK